jgi:cytochrome c
MKKIFTFFLMACAAMALPAAAADRGTAEEAVSLTKKAMAHIKTAGKDKALADFNDPKGAFVDRDLYVVVVDFSGKVLAHGANARLVGKDLMEVKDTDGKAFVKEQVATAKDKGKGWVDFKWTNPVSKQIEQRSFYLEKMDGDYLIGAGIFKP